MPHALCISFPWFIYTYNIQQGAQNLKLIIMQFSPASCCFLLRSTHFLMILYSNTLRLFPSLTKTDQLSYPYRVKDKNYSFVYCNFYVFWVTDVKTIGSKHSLQHHWLLECSIHQDARRMYPYSYMEMMQLACLTNPLSNCSLELFPTWFPMASQDG